jgi:putative transposase
MPLACPAMRERKHIRLREYDYSSANQYFITICVSDFEHFFGEIRNGIMRLSDIGNAASLLLQEIPTKRTDLILDEFMVMPNHVHCIIEILRKVSQPYLVNRFSRPIPGSVSMIMNQYKGDVKKWCNRNGFEHFKWQARFHDHVIKNQIAYENIKRYIAENPRNWINDRFHRRDMPTACPPSK